MLSSTSLYAAIDLGSNSFHMLVVREVAGSIQTLARIKRKVRLAAGLDNQNHLSQEAMERGWQCLKLFSERLQDIPLDQIRVVATATLRLASNAEEFLQTATDILGCPIQVISGEEEARLAYRGCTTNLIPDTNGHLIIDIGGGSTELIIGTTQLSQAYSIDAGAVRMTERHLRHDPPQPEELLNAIGEVQDLFDDVLRLNPSMAHVRQIIGTAGTIVTIAAVELGQQLFNADELHGMHLTRDAIEDVFRTLATEPLVDRVHNPGLPRDRADVIVGGCCVLVALMRSLDANELIVSTNNILDGICAQLLCDL